MACKRLDAMVGATMSYDAGSRAYNTSVTLGNALPNNALEGGSGDTITSGNVSIGNVSNANGGNVIAPTNTEFGTLKPPSELQSPTSSHIPNATEGGLSGTALSHWKASRSENLQTATQDTTARGLSGTTLSCPLPVASGIEERGLSRTFPSCPERSKISPYYDS